jgi:ankyrin repeat protein
MFVFAMLCCKHCFVICVPQWKQNVIVKRKPFKVEYDFQFLNTIVEDAFRQNFFNSIFCILYEQQDSKAQVKCRRAVEHFLQRKTSELSTTTDTRFLHLALLVGSQWFLTRILNTDPKLIRSVHQYSFELLGESRIRRLCAIQMVAVMGYDDLIDVIVNFDDRLNNNLFGSDTALNDQPIYDEPVNINPLLLAARFGHANFVEAVLTRPGRLHWEGKAIDINDQDDNGFTALHFAAMYNHIGVVNVLMRHGARTDVSTNRSVGYPLDFAAALDYCNIVKRLLNGETNEAVKIKAIHIVAAMGCDDVLHILLQGDSQLKDKHDDQGKTPLTVALAADNMTTVRQLMNCQHEERAPTDNEAAHLPVLATLSHAVSGDFDCVDSAAAVPRPALAMTDCDVVSDTVKTVRQGKHPRKPRAAVGMRKCGAVKTRAPTERHSSTVAPVDASDEAAVNWVMAFKQANDTVGNSSTVSMKLRNAVMKDDAKTIELLFMKGVKQNTVDEHKNSFMHLAASENKVKVLKRFLSSNLKWLAEEPNEDRDIPLHLAIRRGNTNAVKCLVEVTSTLDRRNAHDRTALHQAVYFHRDEEIITHIVEAIESSHKYRTFNKVDEYGFTALHYAVMSCPHRSYCRCIQKLSKLNPGPVGEKQISALHLAAATRDLTVLESVLATFYRRNDCRYSGTVSGVSDPGTTQLKDTEQSQVNNCELLMDYTVNAGKEIVKAMRNIDAIDGTGRTALMICAENVDAAGVELLLNNGAELDVVNDKDSTTLLHQLVLKTVAEPNVVESSLRVFNVIKAHCFAVHQTRMAAGTSQRNADPGGDKKEKIKSNVDHCDRCKQTTSPSGPLVHLLTHVNAKFVGFKHKSPASLSVLQLAAATGASELLDEFFRIVNCRSSSKACEKESEQANRNDMAFKFENRTEECNMRSRNLSSQGDCSPNVITFDCMSVSERQRHDDDQHSFNSNPTGPANHNKDIYYRLKNVQPKSASREGSYYPDNILPTALIADNDASEYLDDWSCLELVTIDCNDKEKFRKVLKIEPLNSLVDLLSYGRFAVFITFVLLHITYMACFSVYTIRSCYNYTAVPAVQNDVHHNPTPYWYCLFLTYPLLKLLFLVAELMTLCSSNDFRLRSLFDYAACECTYLAKYLVFQLFSHLLSLVFSILVIVCYTQYLLMLLQDAVTFATYARTVSAAILVGWLYTIELVRGIPAIQAFAKYLKLIFVKDVMRIICIYALVLTGFSLAIHVCILVVSPNAETVTDSFFETFGQMFGAADVFGANADNRQFDRLNATVEAPLVRGLIAIYMLISTIILINVLIAMINQSYNDLYAESELLWHYENVKMLVDISRGRMFAHKWLRRIFRWYIFWNKMKIFEEMTLVDDRQEERSENIQLTVLSTDESHQH